MNPQNNEKSDTCVVKRKLTVIGRFCREQREWNWCSFYQTKSRLCFDSRCGSLLFHKAIENSISVPRNGKSMYARRLTTAAGNKQETSSFQKPFFSASEHSAHSQPQQTVNTEEDSDVPFFVICGVFLNVCVSLYAQTSTSAPLTAPATISVSTLLEASSASVIKATSSTASRTVEVSTANTFSASHLLHIQHLLCLLFCALPFTFVIKSHIY